MTRTFKPVPPGRAWRLFVRFLLLVLIGYARAGYCEDPPQMPIFNPESIQLHAIAWSPDPEKRLAVVDDQVLHVGTDFRGGRVMEIHPEAVEFLYGGKMWTLTIKGFQDPSEKGAQKAVLAEKSPDPGRQNDTPSKDNQKAGEVFPWAAASLPELSNIRSGPDLNAPVVARVEKGRRLQIKGRSGDWLEVKLKKGRQGWIHERLVERLSSQ